MNEGTSIDDLPKGPSIQQQMPVQQVALPLQPNDPQGQGGIALDQTTISQIVSGIQQASVAGATLLPSRDIPMNPTGITHDAGSQPNYIPPPSSTNYIPSPSQTNQEIIDQYEKRERDSNKMDDIYNEIQTPILLALLYFIFQLPIVRKYLLQYLPFLFSTDGNINFNGYVFTSALYGTTYYFLNKLIFQFNRF
jgi:hypothetical protein